MWLGASSQPHLQGGHTSLLRETQTEGSAKQKEILYHFIHLVQATSKWSIQYSGCLPQFVAAPIRMTFALKEIVLWLYDNSNDVIINSTSWPCINNTQPGIEGRAPG